jgi:hypothetical protein
MKKFLVVLLVILLAVVALGHILPADYKLSRSTVIKAPVAKIHEYVGELRNWDAWAPWKEMDPTIVTTFGPKTTGVGAHQSWTGKKGGGELTFTKCDDTGIAYDMVFIMGEERLPSKGWLTYKPVEGGIEVVWGMEGNMDTSCCWGLVKHGPLMLPLMKGSIESEFDKGLAKLKTKAETGP